MPERVLRIDHSDNGVFRVSVNGVTAPRVRAVRFAADAEADSIIATMTFAVTAVDLVDTVASMTAAPPTTEGAE
jgi:hypothetical protein